MYVFMHQCIYVAIYFGKTEAVHCWAHHKKAGFFGKDNDARKMEGSREKGRPIVRWVDSMKGSTGMSLQELIRASEDRAFWTSLLLGWPGV